MAETIRLWSDWSLDPCYLDEGRGVFELTSAEDVAERFDLPEEVVRAVRSWDELFQAHLDWDRPPDTTWATAADHRRYLDRGREVARLLRRYLPPDVGIEYLADESVRERY